MSIELMIFLAVPVMIMLVARYLFPHKISYKEMAIQVISISILVSITSVMGISSQSDDIELLNGEILSKARTHGTYEDSYDCFCVTDSDGFTTCQTCWETHYTVDWDAISTVSNIKFKHLDKTHRRVYNTNDPNNYTVCTVGEPATVEHSYTNWVKAVPDSIFNAVSVDPQYISKLPEYPRVYGHYKINRVINIDSKISQLEINELNTSISTYLKKLGKAKQVNVIVVLTEIDDLEFRYSLESHWQGGNKNDVIVIVGLDDHVITWVDTITFALNSGNEHFQVNMRDRLLNIKTFDVLKISNITEHTIKDYFDRQQMVKYIDHKDDISPPTWALVIMFIFSVFGSLGLSYYFYRNEI